MGVGVADIERAIHWYQEVLGFTLLMGPVKVCAEPGYRATRCETFWVRTSMRCSRPIWFR